MHWLRRCAGFAALLTVAILGGGWGYVAPALSHYAGGPLVRAVSVFLALALGALAGLASSSVSESGLGSPSGSGAAPGRAALRVGRRVLIAALLSSVVLAIAARLSGAAATLLSFAVAVVAVALVAAVGAGLGAFVDGAASSGADTVAIAELALPPAFFIAAANLLFCASFTIARATAGGTLLLAFALALLALGGAWWATRRVGRGPASLPVSEIDIAVTDEADTLLAPSSFIEALRKRLAAEHEAGTAPPPPPTEKERQADDFLAIISAELRAPLEEIATTAALLVAGDRLSAAQQEDVALILAGSGELLGLVEMVLEQPAREPRPTLDLSPVDLAALAREVVSGQRSIWADKGLSVAVHAEGELPPVLGDPRRLKQVLTNLIGNAVKFSRMGEVAVSLATDGDDIAVVVRDEGPGIAAESLPRIFTAYEQAGDAGARAQGSGLGLAICKRLIEAHGGSIAVESTVGVGSIFRVRLPRRGPAGTALPAPPPSLGLAAGTLDSNAGPHP